MPTWFFVSDLHGRTERYAKLLRCVERERPGAVLLGGDLLPHGSRSHGADDFVRDYLAAEFERLRRHLGPAYPRVLLILGNDDYRSAEPEFVRLAGRGLWEYIAERRVECDGHDVYGYPFVPPTPFLLKDWERYDTGRYVDPGCVPPEEGVRSVPAPENAILNATIADDLTRLVAERDVHQAVFLFHSPPHQTKLDRAALDGRMVDHAPVDVHVGSIAIQRFIAERQPLLTLHGHIHESARLTGAWSDRIGRTWCFSAAHHGRELALVRLDPDEPEQAQRALL
ncbi:MAG: metallophosphoesterase [Planctomycetota bacterium]